MNETSLEKLMRPALGRQCAALGLLCLISTPLVAAAQHEYTIAVAEDLAQVRIEARLAPGVDRLRARDGNTLLISGLRDCDGGALEARDGAIAVGERSRCVVYSYPLKDIDMRRAALMPGDVVASTPSDWLWLPRLRGGDSVRVSLAVPEGVGVSVPWVRLGETDYEIRPSPQSGTGLALFGDLVQTTVAVPGATLHATIVNSPAGALDTNDVATWLSEAAADVAAVGGVFPNPDAQVVVISTVGVTIARDAAVPFGRVVRDGGESVEFYLAPNRPLADYRADWTAQHEFAHLLLPFVRQKWVSEGFASYYQNVLLGRRGTYTSEDAWRRLVRSFDQAASIDDPPSPNGTRGRPFWEVRMLIYWSGAALALMADVALREASEGAETLDTVLGRLAACCLPAERTWQAHELFEQLDALTDHPVFMDLHRRYADAAGMPDTAPVLARLGVARTNGGVRFDDTAPLAHVRRAMF